MSGPDLVDKLQHDVYPRIDLQGALKDSVTGKVILITGAGRGIGQATAIAFAHAGASTLILTGRSSHELEATKDKIAKISQAKVICQVVDVTSNDSVKALFDRLTNDNIRIDALLNNAGYLEDCVRMHEGDPEKWRTWEVNVKGTYLPTYHDLQIHIRDPSNPVTIINTSSIGAVATFPGFSSYQPSKSAVNRFTEFIDAEYRGDNVRAFTFHPGGVMTALAGNMPKETHGWLTDTPELAAGFAVWLTAERNASTTNFWLGRYLSANWDVDELTVLKVNPETSRWGEAGWGMVWCDHSGKNDATLPTSRERAKGHCILRAIKCYK